LISFWKGTVLHIYVYCLFNETCLNIDKWPFVGRYASAGIFGNFSQACTNLLEAKQCLHTFFLIEISLLLMKFCTKFKFAIYFFSFVLNVKVYPRYTFWFFPHLLLLMKTSVFDTSYYCLKFYALLTTICICRKSNTKFQNLFLFFFSSWQSSFLYSP